MNLSQILNAEQLGKRQPLPPLLSEGEVLSYSNMFKKMMSSSEKHPLPSAPQVSNDEYWSDQSGNMSPLFSLTDDDVLAHANRLKDSLKHHPRLELEVLRRGLDINP